MSHPGQEHVRVYAPWLAGTSRNESSQFGEDGLVAAALDKLGIKNRWCFEVGAADGVFFSNTKRLYELGWQTVLVEGEPSHWPTLQAIETRLSNVRVVRERIGTDSLDRILSQVAAPLDLDFGVIDIDGQDYWAWQGMRRFRPRLMLVEFRQPQENEGVFIPSLNGEGQASREAIVGLGTEKGYALLATTYVNALFARSELL